MSSKDYFQFYYEWLTPMEGCSPEARCEVYDAIVHLAATGEVAEVKSEVARVAFRYVLQSYERMSQISEVRRQAGATGGKTNKRNLLGFAQAKLKQNEAKHENDDENSVLLGFAQAHIPSTYIPNTIKKDVANATYKESATDVALSSANADDAASSHSAVDVAEYIRAWNNACATHNASMPMVQQIRGQRLEKLRARLREHGKGAVLCAFDKAAASSFLNGGGNNGFVANFDWVVRPNNFPKVLEGNYDTHRQTGYNVGTTQIDNSISKWDGEQEKWNRR